jgi:hypothetical protein
MVEGGLRVVEGGPLHVHPMGVRPTTAHSPLDLQASAASPSVRERPKHSPVPMDQGAREEERRDPKGLWSFPRCNQPLTHFLRAFNPGGKPSV